MALDPAKLPRAEVAYTVAVGEQCRFPEIIGAYDAVAGWAKLHGRELDGPPRETYLTDVQAGEDANCDGRSVGIDGRVEERGDLVAAEEALAARPRLRNLVQ